MQVLGLTEQPDLNQEGEDCCLFSVSSKFCLHLCMDATVGI